MRAGAATAAVAMVLLATGCAGDAAREPTLPSISFSPKLVLELRDARIDVLRGPREDPAVVLDPPTVPGGSVLEVANLDGRAHRLQAGSAFDTGTLRPGEHQTIVLVNDTDADKVLDVRDPDDPAIKATLTVKPRQR